MYLARASCVSPHEHMNHKEKHDISAGLGNIDSGKSKSEEASSSSSSKDDQERKAGDENDVHEAAPMTVIRDPGSPSAEEIELHNTHLPHRSWCPICIKARGKEDAHFKSKKDKSARKPAVAFD